LKIGSTNSVSVLFPIGTSANGFLNPGPRIPLKTSGSFNDYKILDPADFEAVSDFCSHKFLQKNRQFFSEALKSPSFKNIIPAGFHAMYGNWQYRSASAGR